MSSECDDSAKQKSASKDYWSSVTFRLPKAFEQQLKSYAFARSKSFSVVIREALLKEGIVKPLEEVAL